MKKLLSYSLIVLAASLASCSNNKSGSQPSESDANKNPGATTGNNAEHKATDNPNGNSSVKLEQVFADPTYQLTGVAISAKGRLFTNYPLWTPSIYKYALVEVLPNNQVKPFPDAAMNSWKPGESGKNKWVCVQAVYIDDNDAMWVVDPAAPKLDKVYQQSNKLVKINLNTNKPERTYTFEGVTDEHSYINDVRVDTKRQYAYMTNSGTGGIVVVDLKTGKARQLLQNHYSVHSDKDFKFIIGGKELMQEGQPVKFDSDGIALTPDGDWLYYKPLTDTKLYRIKTEFLRNDTLPAQKLKGYVEDLGKFAVTDGMTFDKKGNLYLGDPQNSAILQISPDLKMTTLVKDARLIWPDSYSVSKDGYLYVSCSQIQKTPEHNAGVNKRTTPYTIYRLKLP
ncbi:L-dopachrome tautomerase-related protein [uncultured Mucilaginibacter sp.]|uniref:L-dopachrome tautomerase-related protein n=1 Tax=uncultured Mucilaginibacter sp. TaxID=797541 RepID=UPI0026040BBA|nr:L-dopachrome tautomerase-related protein [uncultured Mucilaginibacter sp.]